MTFSPTGKAHEILLDFGPQPVCSHFLHSADEPQESYPLALAQCQETGLIFLKQPLPVGALVPRFDWIKYNEPEGHLDRMVEDIVRLPGITSRATILGMSYKDDSTLARFERLGFTHTRRIDPSRDLGIHDPNSNIETLQHALTEARADDIASRKGQADVVIARHILEHAENPQAFIAALKALVAPGGRLILEIPDCQKSLEQQNYMMPWEEHTLYFTEQTFRAYARAEGLAMEAIARYCYPFEDSLVGHFRVAESRAGASVDVTAELNRGRRYGAAFAAHRDQTRAFFKRHSAEKIALFGAGHLACSFVNTFGVSEHIQFVADDDPHKQGLLMPGSKLSIRLSSAMVQNNIQRCLFGINPIAEARLIEKLGPQIPHMHSLFPGGKNYYLAIGNGARA
ncbi:MAG TPA: methyltransferase domain-containing protein [Novimethylophilus sp.]|jgi:SAM-dependent methyltransferase|uniref:methyltransferase domain-containing protein n=1 Tax=Novimethylophilus sp. TaxID=2137426 RepID=UPI002F41D523